MKKTIAAMTTAALAAALLAGCGGTPDASSAQQGSQDSSTSQQTGAETRVVTDMGGTEVTLPAEVKSVVNLWPSSNSAMLALGAGDLLVGTMDYTKELPWANFVYPDIVNVATATENAEELLMMNPDVIICPSPDTAEALNNAGLPAMYLMYNDYGSMREGVTLLGEILGGEYVQKAEDWCALLDENLAVVDEALSGLSEEDKPLVYYIQGMTDGGLYTTYGANTIVGEWVNYAGGVFASDMLNLEGSQAQAEEVLALDPDVVIIGGPAQHKLYDDLMADPAWQDITAVKEGRVYTNPMGLFPWDRYSLESALQILWAAQTLHPDLVDVDMEQKVQEFYQDFVGVELTEEQAGYILAGLTPEGEIDYEG